jgi:hypothetical protein
MKNLIRQFEVESHIDVYGLGKDRDKWEAVLEKFAELIVRECIDIADEYDGVGSTIVGRIEKHFGVEE